MGEPTLVVKNLCYTVPGEKSPLFEDLCFELNKGDVLVVRGKSGCGKTTLLKCLSHLNVYTGQILLHGQTPLQYGIPVFRTKVCYVPQRPSLLASTPMAFLKTVHSFASRKAHKESEGEAIQRAVALGEKWGVERYLWDKDWNTLSGGETQRAALAIAVSLPGPVVLLLDEPTSALDEPTSEHVEKTLVDLCTSEESSLQALVWITHSDEQADRVGTRTITLGRGSGSTAASIMSA